jgi:hypothetical protein
MAFLTFNDLSTRSFEKSNNLNVNYNLSRYGTKIFLSYRREDKDLVVPVANFLRTVGVQFYIDYLDNSLEDDNTVVASQLRERISECKKFLTIATPNSAKSKWMPWELGLGDRIVNFSNVAILPITNNRDYWGDQEYGKIYTRIEMDNAYLHGEQWKIVYPDGRKINLLDWFKA